MKVGPFYLEVLLMFVLLVCYIIAWVFTMQLVTRAAADKGYKGIDGYLWFIGLCGFVFTPAIIVAALPSKGNVHSGNSSSEETVLPGI